MDDPVVDYINVEDPNSYRRYLYGGISPNRNKEIQEVSDVSEILMRLDLNLAYSFEKLMNLDIFLMQVSLKNDGGLTMESNYDSRDSLEKALAFDLLSRIMDSEVREVENSISTLQSEVIDAGRNMSSGSRHLRELLIVEQKLCDIEEYMKQSRVNVLEMKKQADKMQRVLIASLRENWRNDMDYSEDDFPRVDTNSDTRMVKQRRHILRMLEKSIARELDLEKKISELERNEVELTSKLHLTEQVALCMEETSEVVWGRFLEAENVAEVLMGTSKELLGELQTVHCHLSGSVQREDELNSRLQDCTEQLKSHEETYLLEQAEANYVDDNEEFTLRQKVTLLEEQLEESAKQLKSADAYNRLYVEKHKEMEDSIESLKDSIFQVEIRAESAESKLSVLTDTNMELMEELGFLKGSENKTSVENESLLEKVTELEIQLQQAKASAEASQEQQIMLYSAIWDMETLIGDLKSKALKAESKTQIAEEQCHMLSETNSKLAREANLLKGRIESLEKSLGRANDGQVSRAREINNRMKLIMDMISQLNCERENIQNQFHYYVKENKFLTEKLREAKKDHHIRSHENGDGDLEEFVIYNQESSNGSCRTTFEEALAKSSSDSSKAGGR